VQMLIDRVSVISSVLPKYSPARLPVTWTV
jgi:hypothetical protein